MRNLIINQIHKEKLFKENDIKIIYSIFDEINNFILLISQNMKIYFFSYKMFLPTKIEKEIELESILQNSLFLKIKTDIENEINPFIYLCFKPESDALTIALKSGEIITFDLNTQITKTTNLSNSNAKIIAFEPSPTQSTIIAILSNFTILSLDFDSFEVTNKGDLDDGDQSDSAKDAECRAAQISFRSSGESFSTIFEINGGCKNLVRDTNLKVSKGPARADNKIVFSVAEAPLKNLACHAAFMPNGSLIAFYDKIKGKIVFSEKNCLIHGEFKVVFGEEIKNLEKINVFCLKWNFFNSMILFVFEYEKKFFVQIYNRANYEWTLKQEIVSLNRISNCVFSESSENQLLILFENGCFEIVDFVWEFSSSLFHNNNFSDNFGEIVVNNNNRLKYTPLGKINVPPPLCVKTVDSKGKKFLWFRKFFFSVANEIEVFKSESKEFNFVCNLKINYDFDVQNVKKIIFVPNFKENLGIFVFNLIIENDLKSEKLLMIFYNVEYKNFTIEKIDEEPKKIVEKKIDGINSVIIFNSNKFEKNFEDEFYDENNIKNEKTEKKSGLDLLENYEEPSSKEFYFYLTGIDINSHTQIFSKISENFSENLNFTHETPEKITQIKSVITHNKHEIIVYLTNTGNFYQNGNLLSTNINSFITFKHFLLFSQNSSATFASLRIVDLNDAEIKLKNSVFNTRTLERGSAIVTCSGIKLVLQMPRGNLETVNLRLVVFDEVKKLILNKKYDEAFYICKKNKINLNFLYDLNPNLFMNNLSIFVSKIKTDDINLFINSLTNEKCDEIKILFNENEKETNIEKINEICSNIRKILFALNNDDFISTILLTFSKQTPPLYLDALQLIQRLKSAKKFSLAESALEFLCWIANAETLFDFALKTYDFELVIMCAKFTQKDPKEYLSYLNSLREIEKQSPILMKYQINCDLKNFPDALAEAAKAGEKYFDKCVELVKKHELYDFALKLFNKPEFNHLFRKINELKGDFYYNKKNLEKAALCYLTSNNLQKAFDCYKKMGKVNEAISLMNENVFENLNDLIDVCRIKKSENEIEKIFLFFTNNIKIFSVEQLKTLTSNLIESLMLNKLFSFSYFAFVKISNLTNKNENFKTELEKKFSNEINLSFDLTFNSLKNNLNFFKEKFTRLQTVQQLKKNHPENFIELKNDVEIDNVSETASVNSKSSKFSKSKKKKKNVKKNVKEGSPFEEENLIEILKEMKIEEKEINKIEELIDVLISCKFNEKGEQLKKLKDDYVKNVNNKIDKIFSFQQIQFANEHPEINDLFPELNLNSIINNNNKNNVNIINIKKP